MAGRNLDNTPIMQKLEQVLLKSTRLLLFIAVASPLVASLHFMYPYMSPVVFVFQICTELAAVVLLGLIIIKPEIYKLQLNKLTISLAAFFAVQSLLLFFSIDPMRSFIGSVERMDGVWNLFHYFLFIMTALALFQKEEHDKKLIAFSLAISGIAALRYFLAYLGPLRAFSTYSFGNSGFLGNYLLLHIPFAILLFLKTKSRETKIVILLAIVAYSAVIIHVGNRATFLAWMFGIFALSLYFIIKNKRLRLALAGLLILTSFSYGALKMYRDTPALKNLYFVQKITNWSLSDATVKSRFILWKIAAKGFLEKPIFGWGRENYQNVFNKYYVPEFFNYNSAEQWFDRAHNLFFDELIAGGLIGLLSWVATMFIFLSFLIRRMRSEPEFRDTAAIFAAFLFMEIIQISFSLNTIGAYLPLTLGLFVIASHSTRTQKFTFNFNIGSLRVAGACGILLIIIGGTFFTIFPAVASYNTELAIFSTPENFANYQKAHKMIDAVFSKKNPYRADLLILEGQSISVYADKAPSDPRLPGFQENILALQKDALRYRPDYLRLKSDYGYNLSLQAQRTRKSEDIARAEGLWGELMRDYPTRQQFLLQASIAYHMGGHEEQAVDAIRKALALTPDSPSLLWDTGLALRISGKKQAALDNLAKALNLGYKPNNVFQIVIIGNFFLDLNKPELAKDLYIIGVELYPKDPNLHANLAFLYKKLGDKTRALEEIKKALELSPEHKADIEKFIRSL